MSQPFEVPETLLTWINGRLEKKEQPFSLKAVEFDGDGRVRVEATVQKFMIAADVVVKGRLETDGEKLVVQDLDVDTSNPMVQGMLKSFLPSIIAKARESLGKYDVEIPYPGAAPDGGEAQASA